MARIKFKYIEAFYKTEWQELLHTFHVKDRMSSFEISEKIQRDTGIEYTYRQIQNWLRKFEILRTHGEALKNRVLTGRMDYSRRKLDYQGRFIDYGARDKGYGYLWAVGLKTILRNKGDTKRLAEALGLDGSDVSDWKNLRHRVSIEYQDRICAYLGMDKTQVFAEVKIGSYPKQRGTGYIFDHRKRLIKKGYKYGPGLKESMYEKGISICDLADKLAKPRTSVSRWISGALISPVDQERVKNILGISKDMIFCKRRPKN